MGKVIKGDKEFYFVSEDKYDDDIEDQVKIYLRTAISLPVYEHVQELSVEPDFKGDKDARTKWRREEIRRCDEGYNGMCGKMYFYFNYCFIKKITGGVIRPEFRAVDAEWFNLVEQCQREGGYGIVCVKRRRVGASWKEGSDAIHDMMFSPHFQVGMNSKSDRDSVHLFDKVMFIYNRLPNWMRAKIGSKNGMHIEFFKYDFYKEVDGKEVKATPEELKKNGKSKYIKRKKGQGSSIIVVPPTDSAYEGMMLNKWVCDEAGKIANLPQLWSFTEDCLMDEMHRAGIPILFGTSGDISTTGGGLMHMWEKSEFYKLRRFFFAGWMGLACDEKGNDYKEESIRWVLYERARRAKISPKEFNDFLQRYPLTVDEAFSIAGGGLGNSVIVNGQRAKLRAEPPIKREGTFKLSEEAGITFNLEKFGDVHIYEHPKLGSKYIAGCDPADHDDVGADSSDLSLHIIKLPEGLEPAKIVLEYCCRPIKLAEYYEKTRMALEYYNEAKILIENNRYRMLDYFKENNYSNLLAKSPNPINNVFKKKQSTYGVKMTEAFKMYMEGLIVDYIDSYSEYIPSIELLNEFSDYGNRNTDRVVSFGLSLAYLKEVYKGKEIDNSSVDIRIPRVSWKMINGKMRRFNSKF